MKHTTIFIASIIAAVTITFGGCAIICSVDKPAPDYANVVETFDARVVNVEGNLVTAEIYNGHLFSWYEDGNIYSDYIIPLHNGEVIDSAPIMWG